MMEESEKVVTSIHMHFGSVYNGKYKQQEKVAINASIFISGIGVVQIDADIALETLTALQKQIFHSLDRKLGLKKKESE